MLIRALTAAPCILCFVLGCAEDDLAARGADAGTSDAPAAMTTAGSNASSAEDTDPPNAHTSAPDTSVGGADTAASEAQTDELTGGADDDSSREATDDGESASSDSSTENVGGMSNEPEQGPGGAGSVPDAGHATGIVVQGRTLVVDGVALQLRGVNWNPVPKGATHPDGLDYAGFADQDIALMRAAGINAVRTYERLEDRAVLDKLHAAGIHVFSTVYGWWQDEPSVVVERVNAVKDHPAILAWVLGNEWNYNHLYGNESLSLEDTRDRINEAAALIKAADPAHPVASIYGELSGLDAMIAAMPDIDIWGVNVYRGIGFGDLFTSYASISDKPLFLGEYGADAYNADLGAYDPDSQADAVRTLTQLLLDDSAREGGVALGGFVFEWADEWWKASGDPSVQDTGGAAPGGGPHPDGVFNEEFWGIVDIDRNPRPAYDALVELYTE